MRDVSPINERCSAEWLAGYRSALRDLEAIMQSLGGPGLANLSGAALARLKSRLVEIEGGRRAA